MVKSENGEIITRIVPDPEYEEISLTPESAITKLNDGGYVSLSLHCKGVRGFKTSESSSQLVLTEEREFNIKELYKRYGNFKAAYVGENGDPSKFSANGEKLTLTIFGTPAWKYILFLLSFFGEPVAIVLLIIINIKSKSKRQWRNSDKP